MQKFSSDVSMMWKSFGSEGKSLASIHISKRGLREGRATH